MTASELGRYQGLGVCSEKETIHFQCDRDADYQAEGILFPVLGDLFVLRTVEQLASVPSLLYDEELQRGHWGRGLI